MRLSKRIDERLAAAIAVCRINGLSLWLLLRWLLLLLLLLLRHDWCELSTRGSHYFLLHQHHIDE